MSKWDLPHGLTGIQLTFDSTRTRSEEVESDLRFLGLIVFENKLKPGTGAAIRNLLNAHIPCRMVTGDNIRTAVSVARECGMVNYHDHVYMPTFKEGDMSTPKSIIEWNHVEDERLKLDPYSLKVSPLPKPKDI